MSIIRCYKIFDIDPNGGYKTLFHGVGGTKKIPFNTWLKAECKWAGEGGKKYWTGFHVLLNKEDAQKYLKRFKDRRKQRVVIECFAIGLRPKLSSNGLVFLATKIKIPKQ